MTDRVSDLNDQLQSIGTDDSGSEARMAVLLELAEAYIEREDMAGVMEVTKQVNELSSRIQHSKGTAYGMLYDGLICCFTARHQEGIRRAEESRARMEEMEDEVGAAKASFVRGMNFRSIGEYDKALADLHAALEKFEKVDNRFYEADLNYSLGLLYHELGDYTQALERHRRAIKVFGDDDKHFVPARALNGVGLALTKMGKPEEALDYHHQGLAMFREIENAHGEARALDDIGSVYMLLGDHDLALQFHEKSLQIREETGQRRAQCTSLLNIARAHIAARDPDRALPVLEKALTLAEETESKAHIYDAHAMLSETYELRGDYKKALAHHKLFQKSKEAVFNEKTAERIQKLQIGFEVQKAEQEAEFERLRNVELNEKNEKLEELLRELHATQGQLVQSEKMAALGKLVAGLMHELNTPMGASNSAIDVSDRCVRKIVDLKSDEVKLSEALRDGSLEGLLGHLEENHRVNRDANERVARILGNLRSFIRLDAGEREAVDLHDGLESTLALLESDLDDRIEIVREYGTLPPVTCYPGEMNQVFMSLLTNAVEAIDGEGTVTIRTAAANGTVRVSIIDTGRGIPEDDRGHLFDPSFGAKRGARVKAGMGLMVSLNIVRKHGGQIDVESEVGKGSVFSIVLPIPPAPSNPRNE